MLSVVESKLSLRNLLRQIDIFTTTTTTITSINYHLLKKSIVPYYYSNSIPSYKSSKLFFLLPHSRRMAATATTKSINSDDNGRERTPTTRISAILFDLDNTLIPTRRADDITAIKISEKINREFGIPLPIAREASDAYLRRFRRNVENPHMSLDDWRLLLWVNALPEEYEEFAEEIYGKWKRMRYRNLVVPESTLTLLRTLRKEYQLALITNGPSKSQWEKIRELKLEEYFDYILVSGDIGCEKPEKKFFKSVLKSLGVKPFECLIVGDRLDTDIQGGLAAELGITVWYSDDVEDKDPPIQRLSLNPQPDFIIRDISDLLGLLGKSKKNERTKTSKSVKPVRGKATGVATSTSSGASSSASSSSSSTGHPQPPQGSSPIPQMQSSTRTTKSEDEE